MTVDHSYERYRKLCTELGFEGGSLSRKVWENCDSDAQIDMIGQLQAASDDKHRYGDVW